jgi:hypothetical protein
LAAAALEQKIAGTLPAHCKVLVDRLASVGCAGAECTRNRDATEARRVPKGRPACPPTRFRTTPRPRSHGVNAVKGFFGQIVAKRLNRGRARSVLELYRAIDACVPRKDTDPKPFV